MAESTEAKKGRRVKGRVFSRGSVYYLRFRVGTDPNTGKPNERTVRLVDPETQLGVTDERQAKTIAESILAPYRAHELTALRASAVEALRTAEEAAALAETARAAALYRKTPITKMWDTFPPKTTIARKPGARVRQLTPATVAAHKSAWGKFCRFMAGRYPEARFAEDVTQDHAAAFAEACLSEEGVCRASLNNTLAKVSTMFKRAKLADPFSDVERFDTSGEHETREPLSEDELRAVCGAARGELRLLLACGLFTGLRLGDCCQLRWGQNVRLADRRISRRTAKARRDVSIALHPELQAILQETPPAARKGYVMPGLAALYQKRSSDVSGLVARHFRRCGVETTRPAADAETARKRGVSVRTFHALRHCFITFCAKAGVAQGAIAAWCGHSPEIDRLYQHFGGSDTDGRILAALPSVLDVPKAIPAALEPERERLRAIADGADMGLVQWLLAKADERAR